MHRREGLPAPQTTAPTREYKWRSDFVFSTLVVSAPSHSPHPRSITNRFEKLQSKPRWSQQFSGGTIWHTTERMHLYIYCCMIRQYTIQVAPLPRKPLRNVSRSLVVWELHCMLNMPHSMICSTTGKHRSGVILLRLCGRQCCPLFLPFFLGLVTNLFPRRFVWDSLQHCSTRVYYTMLVVTCWCAFLYRSMELAAADLRRARIFNNIAIFVASG